MRIAIIGSGAIGCVVGGMLTKAGRDVTLIDQWPEHVDTIKRQGLRLSGTCGDHVIRVKALHVHELQSVTQPFDAVFVAVKSYDTEWATALALPYLARPDGVVVDFQNGINDERVAAVAGRERTLGCVITIGAGLYEAGHAMRTDSQAVGFKIGELDGRETDRARKLAEVMNDVAGAKVTTNLFGERWSKLTVNCMANPLAGLSGLGSAEIRSVPEPARIAVQVAAEAILVGRKCGFEVEPIYGVDEALGVDAVDRLHLEAALAADQDCLGGHLHGDARRLRHAADLGRAEAAQPGQRVGHAVDRQLRPPLAEQVGRDLRAGHVVHDLGQLACAVGLAAIQLADLEADGLAVGAHGVARLVEAGTDRDDAAERALAAGYRRHPLVVDAVLEVDHDPVRTGQVGQRQRGGPLGVVRLHRNEDRVERLGDRLQLVHVQGLDADDVVAASAGQPQPLPLDRLHVLRPLVDERDVTPRLGEHPADDTPDRARADDGDTHGQPPDLISRIRRFGPCQGRPRVYHWEREQADETRIYWALSRVEVVR